MRSSAVQVSRGWAKPARHALAAFGVAATAGMGISACRSSSKNIAGPTTTIASAPSRDAKGISGHISAESGSIWTVTDKAGKAFTVTITPQTQFGNKKHPANAQQFVVGTAVRVVGAINGLSLTATKIVLKAPAATTTAG